jgi:prepilin-type N-terminal cleavage/methylation domain-containing protein
MLITNRSEYMRPIRHFQNSGERGFTLLELLVTLFISAIILDLIAKALPFQSDRYLEDMARTRVQQNLRGALDVVSMNVRQAGENFDVLFPALLLSTTSGASTLTLRRKLLHEVPTICKAIVAGNTKIYVSSSATGSISPDCLHTNIVASNTVGAWSAYRATQGGSLWVYLYDRVGKTGEFVNYLNEGTQADPTYGDTIDYLQTSAVAHAYPTISTSVYVIEEALFKLDATSKTLQLFWNGDTTISDDVAYNITQFQASIGMQDGTSVSSLAASDTNTWKNIRSVAITVSGQDQWRNKTVQRTVVGSYFPRNVLSE